MSTRCIWCGEIGADPDIEHIIPEAMGCPPAFILTGGVVCKRCNNGLAHLDSAVANEFDLLSFISGVPRKGGKPPAVASRGNVFGSYFEGSPTLSFNMERHAVEAHDGSHLASFHGSARNVPIKVTVNGSVVTASGSAAFGQSPKFLRGLAKIALSSVAYFLGAEAALDARHDRVRDFVVLGIGERHALVRFSEDSTYRNTVWAPFQSENGGLAVTFRLAIVEILMDLSADEDQFPLFEAKQRKTESAGGWCVLPTRG